MESKAFAYGVLMLLFLVFLTEIQEAESWRQTLRNRCRRGRCAICYRHVIRLSYGYYDVVTNGPPKVVRARCRRGHQLIGEAELTCDETTRRFRERSHSCLDDDECQIRGSETLCPNHSTCVNTPGGYRCDCLTGYMSDGDGNCTRINKCPPLLAPDHGQVLTSSSRLVTFRCDDGYIVAGFSTVNCDQQTGEWSNQPPLCVLSYNNCGDPGAPQNGIKYGSCHRTGCQVRFQCEEDYILDGNTRMECLPGQRWSGWLPVCRKNGGVGAAIREHFLDEVSTFTSSSVDWKSMDRVRLNIQHAIGIDLVFMFDRSSSIAEADFRKGIRFAQFILEELGVANKTDATRVACVSFGDDANLEFNLNDQAVVGNLTAAKAKLSQMQPSGGGTATTRAFELVVEHVIPQLRPRAKHAVFLITDGRSNMGGSPEAIAANIRTRPEWQFEIYAVGVGNDVDRRQLRHIASEPYLEHVFLVEDYDTLDSLTDIIVEKRTNYERCGVSGNIEIIQGQGQGQGDNEGGPEARVVGGDAANQGAWPWVTIVKVIRDDGGTDVVCAGSLLCPGWVLTSAECLQETLRNGTVVQIEAGSLTVTVGEHNRFEEEGAEQTVVVREIIRHPEYQNGQRDNNIALLKLEPEVVINKFVRTICVPKNDSEVTLKKSTHRPSTTTWFAGWGTMNPTKRNQSESDPDFLSDLPRQIRIPIADRDFCEDSTSGTLTDDSFCAGYQYQAKDICKGDAGGPLVTRSGNDQFLVIGVAHQAETCAQYNQYGVFTDVLLFLTWITEVTEGCNLAFH